MAALGTGCCLCKRIVGYDPISDGSLTVCRGILRSLYNRDSACERATFQPTPFAMRTIAPVVTHTRTHSVLTTRRRTVWHFGTTKIEHHCMGLFDFRLLFYQVNDSHTFHDVNTAQILYMQSEFDRPPSVGSVCGSGRVGRSVCHGHHLSPCCIAKTTSLSTAETKNHNCRQN
jgi:hypothetical protein